MERAGDFGLGLEGGRTKGGDVLGGEVGGVEKSWLSSDSEVGELALT